MKSAPKVSTSRHLENMRLQLEKLIFHDEIEFIRSPPPYSVRNPKCKNSL